jgi:hypothetical protein
MCESIPIQNLDLKAAMVAMVDMVDMVLLIMVLVEVVKDLKGDLNRDLNNDLNNPPMLMAEDLDEDVVRLVDVDDFNRGMVGIKYVPATVYNNNNL